MKICGNLIEEGNCKAKIKYAFIWKINTDSTNN